LLGLPKVENPVSVQRDIAITMQDGETLSADHYIPDGNGNYPTILIRSPWGRGSISSPYGILYGFIAQRFAEHGYHVILQETRQAQISGDDLSFFHEAEDGKDTLEWISQQPWYSEKIGLWGASYLGYVQWAAAAALRSSDQVLINAMVPIATASCWTSLFYPDGVFGLDTVLRLRYIINATDQPLSKMISLLRQQERTLAPSFYHLPVDEIDQVVMGKKDPDYQVSLAHPPDDSFWRAMDFREAVPDIHARVHLVAGWYDVFLREQLADYTALQSSGQTPHLTIGP
jgi:putative CocE/NonD family hydrolase